MSHVLRNWDGEVLCLSLRSLCSQQYQLRNTGTKPSSSLVLRLSVWSELLIGMVGPKQNVALTIQGIVFPIAVTQSLYQWERTEQMRTYKMNSAITRESDINVLFGLLVSVRIYSL